MFHLVVGNFIHWGCVGDCWMKLPNRRVAREHEDDTNEALSSLFLSLTKGRVVCVCFLHSIAPFPRIDAVVHAMQGMAVQSRQRSGDGGPPATSAWTVPLYTTAAQRASSLLSSASTDREQQHLLHRPGSSSQTSNPVMLGTDQMASSSSGGDDSDSGCDEGDRQGLLRIDALESSILANYPVADCTDDTGTGGGGGNSLSHLQKFICFVFV